MRIRAWEEKDVEEIAKIEEDSFSDPWTGAQLKECLLYPHYRCFLAEEGGQVCGYCCIIVLFENADLANIAVARGYRGRGIAKELLRVAFSAMQEAGAETCFLEVRESNLPAISLYEGFGFARCGTRKGYYPDGEDALLMRKRI